MTAEIAVRMVSADFLKLRKKRGTLIWSLVLTLAPVLIFFIVRAVQHYCLVGLSRAGQFAERA